jgi:hypothetical protein
VGRLRGIPEYDPHMLSFTYIIEHLLIIAVEQLGHIHKVKVILSFHDNRE